MNPSTPPRPVSDTPAKCADASYWKGKLAAFLHDPPEKALDLAWHRQRAEAHQSGHDLEDVEFVKTADHTAAAADRLPWPTYDQLKCAFDGEKNHFKHPLGQASLKIKPFVMADLATGKAWGSRPLLAGDPAAPGFDRAQFFAYWRLWRWWASDQRHPRDPRLAFLPADTRIPDHTIWAHNSLVSALQGCVEDGVCRPAFLLFNLGPVQEYIAAARRTLDLWSGSYLLSYLIGTGLRQIALTLGPDHVIFPNLCGQPIFDLLMQDDIWAQSSVHAETSDAAGQMLWDSIGYNGDYPRKRLLTPSLPNRFLALVPEGRAADIAREVANTIRKTHEEIATAVWKLASDKIGPRIAEQHTRFLAQSSRFLELTWQTLRWDEQPAAAHARTAHLPSEARSGLETVLELARKTPKAHRDVRNFECPLFPDGTHSARGRDISGWKDKSKLADDAPLDNPGAAWSALYALLIWQLDAVRQSRAWQAWETADQSVGLDNNKDSLNGREEAVLNLATDEVTEENIAMINEDFGIEHLFKKGEIIGASSLIKRLWPTAWLQAKHEIFKKGDFSAPDTRDIANHHPYASSGDEDRAGDRDNDKAYFAVLAFDGDEMGKWISGTHQDMPKLGEALANYPAAAGEHQGAKKYFEENDRLRDLLGRNRPLNPSFHLQFSEMLGNFSNLCARRVVEAFDGYLFYAGGDDVLAMLPANQALACAQALRAAFQGTLDLNKVHGAWRNKIKDEPQLFAVTQVGFIQLHPDAPSMAGEPKGFPAIVPGPATDCSVGIAIAHFKAPLQDVVRAAQLAEKRAKQELGRAAVAVSLFKRSGEITEWGCKWQDGGIALYEAIRTAIERGELSAKFPHRACELLSAYQVATSPLMDQAGSFHDAEGFTSQVDEIIRREFAHALSRQHGPDWPGQTLSDRFTNGQATGLLDKYLAQLAVVKPAGPECTPQNKLSRLVGLLTAVAWNRPKAEDKAPATVTAPLQPAERQPAP